MIKNKTAFQAKLRNQLQQDPEAVAAAIAQVNQRATGLFRPMVKWFRQKTI